MLLSSGLLDGNFAVRLDSNSCSRTNTASGPWWLVDLGQNYQVTQVAITTRNDDFCSVCGNIVLLEIKVHCFWHAFRLLDDWTIELLSLLVMFSSFEQGNKRAFQNQHKYLCNFAEDRFNNFYVGVGTAFDDKNIAKFDPTPYNVCWYQNTSVSAGKTWVFTCTEEIKEITGRFVTIYFPTTKTQSSSLCEVQVTNSKILHLSQ